MDQVGIRAGVTDAVDHLPDKANLTIYPTDRGEIVQDEAVIVYHSVVLLRKGGE